MRDGLRRQRRSWEVAWGHPTILVRLGVLFLIVLKINLWTGYGYLRPSEMGYQGRVVAKGSINEPLLRHSLSGNSQFLSWCYLILTYCILFYRCLCWFTSGLIGYSPAGAPKTHGTSRTFSPGAFNTLKSQFF